MIQHRPVLPRRGFFGIILKYVFIAYNGIMLLWLVSYWVSIAPKLGELTDDASRLGGSVGAMLGTGMIAGLWMAGAVVLGLFVLLTRPRS